MARRQFNSIIIKLKILPSCNGLIGFWHKREIRLVQYLCDDETPMRRLVNAAIDPKLSANIQNMGDGKVRSVGGADAQEEPSVFQDPGGSGSGQEPRRGQDRSTPSPAAGPSGEEIVNFVKSTLEKNIELEKQVSEKGAELKRRKEKDKAETNDLYRKYQQAANAAAADRERYSQEVEVLKRQVKEDKRSAKRARLEDERTFEELQKAFNTAAKKFNARASH